MGPYLFQRVDSRGGLGDILLEHPQHLQCLNPLLGPLGFGKAKVHAQTPWAIHPEPVDLGGGGSIRPSNIGGGLSAGHCPHILPSRSCGAIKRINAPSKC